MACHTAFWHAGKSEAGTTEMLLQEPEARKYLSKILLADEWAESLKQSHPESEQQAANLQAFWQDIEFLKAQFNKVVPGGNVVHWLRDVASQQTLARLNWI